MSKVYDGDATVSNLTTSNYNISGFVLAEGATIDVTSGSYDAGKNVGGPALAVTSATLAAGNYHANVGTDLSNYDLTAVTNTTAAGNIGAITQKALTAVGQRRLLDRQVEAGAGRGVVLVTRHAGGGQLGLARGGLGCRQRARDRDEVGAGQQVGAVGIDDRGRVVVADARDDGGEGGEEGGGEEKAFHAEWLLGGVQLGNVTPRAVARNRRIARCASPSTVGAAASKSRANVARPRDAPRTQHGRDRRREIGRSRDTTVENSPPRYHQS